MTLPATVRCLSLVPRGCALSKLLRRRRQVERREFVSPRQPRVVESRVYNARLCSSRRLRKIRISSRRAEKSRISLHCPRESSLMTQSRGHVGENWVYALPGEHLGLRNLFGSEFSARQQFRSQQIFFEFGTWRRAPRYLCSATFDLTRREETVGKIRRVAAERRHGIHFESEFLGIVGHVWLGANCARHIYLPTRIQLRHIRFGRTSVDCLHGRRKSEYEGGSRINYC